MAYDLDRNFELLAHGAAVTFAFTHNGDRFRIVMEKYGAFRSTMTAYTGDNGPITHKNKIEKKWSVYCHAHKLRECIEEDAARVFGINPKDVSIVDIQNDN